MKMVKGIVRSIWRSEGRGNVAINMEALEERALCSATMASGGVEPSGVQDGTSSTLMIGEGYVRPSIWDGKTQQTRQVTLVQDM